MEITKTEIVKEKYIVLRLVGEISLYNAIDIKQWFDEFFQKTEYEGLTPVLEMSAVPYIDSSGIGTLISIDSRMKKQRASRLILTGLSAGVQKVFTLSRLHTFFAIYSSVDNL